MEKVVCCWTKSKELKEETNFEQMRHCEHLYLYRGLRGAIADGALELIVSLRALSGG